MPAARPLPSQALRKAAQIAREEGVTVVVERDGDGALLYRITPAKNEGGALNPADLVDMRE